MLDKTITSKTQSHPQNILKKTPASKSCQSLLCLTQHCKDSQQKYKQRTLSYQFFQKLSLKKFTQPSVLNNSSYDKSFLPQNNIQQYKEVNHFENITLGNNHQLTGESLPTQEGGGKFSIGNNMKFSINNSNPTNINSNNNKSFYPLQQRRIQRSSSQKLFHRPQLLTTQRSIQKELENDVKKISNLQNLKKKLENQIKQLDHNIDKYYFIYNSKIEELKKIQFKMNQIVGSNDKANNYGQNQNFNYQQNLQKNPSFQQLQSFKKKPQLDTSPTFKSYEVHHYPNVTSTTFPYSPSTYNSPKYLNKTIIIQNNNNKQATTVNQINKK